MKASEFVKQVGWLKSYDIVARIPDRFMSCYYDRVCYCTKYKKYSDRFQPRATLVNIADLKRLVESHELVRSYGGIPTVKAYINISANKNTKLFLSLKQAILDVESCQ